MLFEGVPQAKPRGSPNVVWEGSVCFFVGDPPLKPQILPNLCEKPVCVVCVA